MQPVLFVVDCEIWYNHKHELAAIPATDIVFVFVTSVLIVLRTKELVHS